MAQCECFSFTSFCYQVNIHSIDWSFQDSRLFLPIVLLLNWYYQYWKWRPCRKKSYDIPQWFLDQTVCIINIFTPTSNYNSHLLLALWENQYQPFFFLIFSESCTWRLQMSVAWPITETTLSLSYLWSITEINPPGLSTLTSSLMIMSGFLNSWRT